MKNQEQLGEDLKGIRQLLSLLHGEISAFEATYSQLLLVLQNLEVTANRDDLTGLLRRKTFFKKWNDLLTECHRVNQHSGVILIDIDHFKLVNDTHGHPTGDEVIKQVATLLKRFESPDVLVSRYGGEEFAVAMKGTDAQILGLAESIRRSAERLHGPVIGEDGRPNEAVQWKCTLSVGVASSAGKCADAARLLQAADDALYQAKDCGRNRVKRAA